MPNRNRILLIEDNDDSHEVLATLLRHWGFEVTAYDRCKPAEVHLEACDVDVALLGVAGGTGSADPAALSAPVLPGEKRGKPAEAIPQ